LSAAENEKKVLKAVAAAQVETGAPVIIHPGRHPTAPAEALNVLQEAGGDVRRTVMSHLDSTFLFSCFLDMRGETFFRKVAKHILDAHYVNSTSTRLPLESA
jgi:Phosphotriesterase family